MRSIAGAASASALVIVTAAALGGCGLGRTSHPHPAAEAVPHASSAQPAPVVPATVPDSPKLRNSVHITGCDALANRAGWQAAGTVVNNTSKPVDYHITVFFTTAKATDVGYADTTVTAAAGATAKWTASKKFAVPSDLTCVLRAVG